LHEIVSQLDRWLADGESIATATLVEVRGSAPRQPGARFCATASGAVLGSVSAGCVESDVLECARRVMESGRAELATYGISDELGFQVGLSCGGSIDVVVAPFEADEAWRAVAAAVEARRPVVLAQAASPAELCGRQLAVLERGRVAGSIEPELDAAICAAALPRLESGESAMLELERAGGDPARIFLEAVAPPRRLFVIGGNQTAIPLCRMARALGYRVILVDPRTAFATAERFADAHELVHAWPDAVLREAGLDAYSYVVVLTHDLKFDVPAIVEALRAGVPYVGALGSRRTHAKRIAKLREAGLDDADLAKIHAPIGLDLGGRSPEEIALSILAEVQAVRYGRGGALLREGEGRIHAEPERRAGG